MNSRLDLHILGWLLALLGAAQLPVLAVALLQGEPWWPYAVSGGVAGGLGVGLALRTRTSDRRIRPRDGFLVVGVAWVLASIMGAIPFVLAIGLGPVDAFFEAVSGFTTTGSTVISGLESAPRAILFWRSLIQWLGGMGIILFTIAILPLLGIGGMQLFKAEVPGPVADKVRPRVRETARQLWLVYVGLTAAEVVALWLAGLDGFEALCHALTTLATGGFSTRDLSVGAFHSAAVDWIVVAFMLAAGTNFVLHYRLLAGRPRTVWRDTELRYYLLVAAGATAVVATALLQAGHPLEQAVREAAFNTVSILTTTGYVTADFERWPVLPQFVFLLLMVLGGMSGSTAGGVKSLRALLGARAVRASFDRLIHPRVVRPIKHDGRPVPDDVLAGVWAFLITYFAITVAVTGFLAAYGYDLVTAGSAALTAIGNVGPGLGEVGAYDNFAALPGAVKLALAFAMLAGRLEIFTLVVLLTPQFWRR
jgi:trk system potassium uptake protein TrkH